MPRHTLQLPMALQTYPSSAATRVSIMYTTATMNRVTRDGSACRGGSASRASRARNSLMVLGAVYREGRIGSSSATRDCSSADSTPTNTSLRHPQRLPTVSFTISDTLSAWAESGDTPLPGADEGGVWVPRAVRSLSITLCRMPPMIQLKLKGWYRA